MIAEARPLTWRQRRDQATCLIKRIQSDGLTTETETQLEAIANDPKWEIRKEIADHLLELPEDAIPRYAARLQADDNHFVAAAATRALQRLRRGQQAAFRQRKGMLEVQDQYLAIERLHGRIAANKARRMAEGLADTIVGAAVHEMRGLLTPLVDWVDGIRGQQQHGRLDQRSLPRTLDRMAGRLDMMHQILEDMREYSRCTPCSRRPESLSRLISDANQLACDWFTAQGIDLGPLLFQINVPQSLMIEVARHQLLMALRNVIKNAIESLMCRRGRLDTGTIAIDAWCDDGWTVIRIRDTGMGLSNEELAELRRFVPGRTSKKRSGTGFGLPIAHRKLQDHGGCLHLDSTIDVGTTVTLTLPLEAPDDDDAAAGPRGR